MTTSIPVSLDLVAMGVGLGTDGLAQALTTDLRAWIHRQAVAREALNALAISGGPLIPFELSARNRVIAEALLTAHLSAAKKEVQTIIHSEHSFASVGLLRALDRNIQYFDRGFSDSAKAEYWFAPRACPANWPKRLVKRLRATLAPNGRGFLLKIMFDLHQSINLKQLFSITNFEVQQLSCEGKLVDIQGDSGVLEFAFQRPEQIMRLSTAGLEGAMAMIHSTGRGWMPAFLIRIPALTREVVECSCVFLNDPRPDPEWLRTDTQTQIPLDKTTALKLFYESGYSCRIGQQVISNPDLDIT